MKQSRVSIGDKDSPTYDFYNDDIIDVEGVLSVSLVGEELAADTLTVTVNYNDTDEELRTLPYGTSVWYYIDMELVGRFYSTNVERVGKTHYKINCTSIIGILDKEIFYGGVYNGRRFPYLIREIILTNGLQRYRRVDWVLMKQSYGGKWMKTRPSMQDSFHFEFTYLGLRPEVNELDTLSKFEVLCGIAGEDSTYDYCYGISATLTRASTSDQFSETLSLYLTYNKTRQYVCDIAPNDEVVVDVQPVNGTATINNVTVSITMSGNVDSLLDYPGGALLAPSPYDPEGTIVLSTYKTYTLRHFKIARISSPNGTVVAEWIPISHDPWTEDMGAYYNLVERRAPQTAEARGDFVFYEDPEFFNPNNLQTAFMDSIEYDEGINDVKVYGHLGVLSKREAIHQILFATGVSLLKSQNGKIIFTGLYEYQPETISADDIYVGGDIEYLEDVYNVQLKEHFFSVGSGTEEIYSNKSSNIIGEYIAIYSKAPCYTSKDNLTLEGNIKVLASNQNAAVVTGKGTIKGTLYTHDETVIERVISDNLDGKTIEISDATLVTPQNSEVVADRLEAYYTSVKKVNNSLSITDQKCGRLYSFLSPFRELTNGYLSKIAITKVSAIIKATCEFIAGYIPVSPGGGYSRSVTLTGSGTWTVPEEVFEEQNPRIKIIVVGAGYGGDSGFAGEDGEQSETGWHAGAGGTGGAGGDGGLPGKFLEVTIENPAASYVYSCGEGGQPGGVCTSPTTNNLGQPGGETTFGSYSSADGERSDSGFIGFFNGAGYAFKSYSGKKGGDGGFTELDGSILYAYLADEFPKMGDPGYYEGRIYDGGSQGAKIADSTGTYAMGGCGGGAAAGQAGHDGGSATQSGGTYRGGNGGDGADAVFEPMLSVLYADHGCGGIGGCGGGGGGCSGTTGSGVNGARGTAGKGGKGGKGSKGGDGCVLIYY